MQKEFQLQLKLQIIGFLTIFTETTVYDAPCLPTSPRPPPPPKKKWRNHCLWFLLGRLYYRGDVYVIFIFLRGAGRGGGKHKFHYGFGESGECEVWGANRVYYGTMWKWRIFVCLFRVVVFKIWKYLKNLQLALPQINLFDLCYQVQEHIPFRIWRQSLLERPSKSSCSYMLYFFRLV